VLASLLIFWGVAYAVTIRRASRLAKIGSFATVALVAVATMLFRTGATQAGADADMAQGLDELGRIQRSADPLSERMTGAGGPLSRMMATFHNASTEDFQAYAKAADSAGLPIVVNFAGLTHKSPVLDRCSGIAALAPAARSARMRVHEHFENGKAVGARAVANGELSESGLQGYTKGVASTLPQLERIWELHESRGEAAASLCAVLARRRWVRQGELIGFNNDADMQAAQALLNRFNSDAGEIQRISGAARAKQAKLAN
jgi:hypothetical protein